MVLLLPGEDPDKGPCGRTVFPVQEIHLAGDSGLVQWNDFVTGDVETVGSVQ